VARRLLPLTATNHLPPLRRRGGIAPFSCGVSADARFSEGSVKLLIPGRFTTTSIKTPDGGELEIRLTDGGHWQMKAKLVAEKDWRPLCRGHIDGSIFDAATAGRPNDCSSLSGLRRPDCLH
jgi:hypothetical protein